RGSDRLGEGDCRGRARFPDPAAGGRIARAGWGTRGMSGAWGMAWRNLTRRRLRTALTLAGLAVAVAVMACLLAFGQGYESGLGRELDRMGIQLMIVPLGCPYDAAARVLKGRSPEAGGLQSRDPALPAAALAAARRDPDVAVAAPLLMAAVP